MTTHIDSQRQMRTVANCIGVFCSYNTHDPLEEAMMNSRWKTFTFHHQFSEADQKHTPPCGRCFSLLVMGNRYKHTDSKV